MWATIMRVYKKIHQSLALFGKLTKSKHFYSVVEGYMYAYARLYAYKGVFVVHGLEPRVFE